MSELIPILQNFGFPVFVACVLLYDKIKTNGSLREAVNNNTEAIREIYSYLQSERGK